MNCLESLAATYNAKLFILNCSSNFSKQPKQHSKIDHKLQNLNLSTWINKQSKSIVSWIEIMQMKNIEREEWKSQKNRSITAEHSISQVSDEKKPKSW